MTKSSESKIIRLRRFLEKEIWQMNLSKVTGLRHIIIKLIRTFIIAWRGFKQDNCQLKASALTFYSLLSIVPVIALLFGIAKGFGLEKKLEIEIRSDLNYNREIMDYVFDFSNSMLENTKGGLIAGLGVIFLIWTVMKVLGNIEEAFNDIWEVNKARSLVRKFSDYLSIMLVAPILAITSSSLSVFITSQLKTASHDNELLAYLGPALYMGLRLIPFILTMLTFAVVYMILPNTRVKFSSALYGAFFGAFIFHLVEWAYFSFQLGVSRYNAIYGGFAALPLFLIWLQTSWLIVLLGAEFAFAFQNQSKYEFEIESVEISHNFRFVLAIAVIRALVKRFEKGEVALTASDLSTSLELPAKMVRKILHELVQCGILTETSGENKDEASYQPAVDIAQIDVSYVERRMNDAGINELPVVMSEDTKQIEELVRNLRNDMAASKSNVLIKNL